MAAGALNVDNKIQAALNNHKSEMIDTIKGLLPDNTEQKEQIAALTKSVEELKELSKKAPNIDEFMNKVQETLLAQQAETDKKLQKQQENNDAARDRDRRRRDWIRDESTHPDHQTHLH